jgi:hypothetical protein
VEAERFLERTIVNEDGEEGKYAEEARLSNISTYYMAKALHKLGILGKRINRKTKRDNTTRIEVGLTRMPPS